MLSIHTSYKAADETARNFQIFGECPMKGVDFVEAYEPITEFPVAEVCEVEPPIVEACEIELQPVAQPVIHPSLDWMANKVWGRDYEDCSEDECLLVDQAKVSKHGYIILRDAKLRNVKLKRANLECADLRQADLEGADLRHANLRHANLRGAMLCDADLECADLEGAVLEGAVLIWARLCKADLRKADLVRANLSEANLDGATIADGYTLTTRRLHQISGVGSEDGTLELYHCHQGWYVMRSCFSGSLPEFLEAVEKTHGDNELGKQYRAIIAALCD